MMLTRCPNAECHTAFRVTPEQLKARGGKVRCGQCQQVFNALEHLIDEGEENALPPASDRGAVTPLPLATEAAVPSAPEVSAPTVADSAGHAEASQAVEALDFPIDGRIEPDLGEVPEENEEATPGVPEFEPLHDALMDPLADIVADAPVEATADASAEDTAEPPEETPAALLPMDPEDPILPRETSAIPGYSKWAETPLAGGGLALAAETTQKPRWPFLLAIVLLCGSLLGQTAHRFRTELAILLPSLQPAMLGLGWDIPLARKADLVSIEASDLQADAAKGQLVLQATLKNRAPHVQDLPALELSLTDTQDAVVARRILQPADYLHGSAAPAGFPANGEIAVKLWIETGDLVPSGYRLYVFYP